MKLKICIVFVALLSICAISQAEDTNVKTLDRQESVGEILKDLIANWNSPLTYLRNRGYLSGTGINLDALLSGLKPTWDESPRAERSASDDDSGSDLSRLFRTLFSSDDNSISDKLRSKLGVPWEEMIALKNSVRNNANKLYESFYNRNNQRTVAQPQQTDNGDTDIERQVAQLYPSVVSNNKDEPSNNEGNPKESIVPTSHKETKHLSGIAKLLSSKDMLIKIKPLPLIIKERQAAAEEASAAKLKP